MAKTKSKKITLEMTEEQLIAIVNITDDISAMIGCGDDDENWKDCVKIIDKMLINNGYKRNYE